jgi:hypothetical protein
MFASPATRARPSGSTDSAPLETSTLRQENIGLENEAQGRRSNTTDKNHFLSEIHPRYCHAIRGTIP